MDQKPIAKKPLLFINQPKMKEPLGLMQSSFTFSAEKAVQTQQDHQPVQEQKRSRKRAGGEELPLSFGESVNEVPQTSFDQQPPQGLKPVKSFPNMTIDEKLDYIFSSPQFYFCAFKTTGSEFVGKIKELYHDHIIVMTSKGSMQRIERKDLTGIRIIG
ncbi:CotO family spore coat protein [Siminovitchia sp. 179-K 8D1 HS]|uniref:CotO family spore coat protein n=1 Tax=Siminovitchia sp. 179-K 8D1 HS TaxID=3142385 RepID=UPI00399F3425